MALVENIQRSDLDPIEIAMCCDKIISESKLTQDELSIRIGKKRTTITNYLRLLKLNPIIQSGIRDGFISMGHGRALLSISNSEIQMEFYKKIISKNLSVRQTEKIIKEKNKLTTLKSEDFTKEHISFLSKYFGSKVVTSLSSKGDGKIIISFKDEDDFNSILKKFK